MKRMNNDGVSPVVGVMLMLVVTIIIAAVVSAFAGGLGGSTEKAPQATIKAKAVTGPIIDTNPGSSIGAGWGPNYTAEFEAAGVKYGIEFEHTGGDPFLLSEINVRLETAGVSMIITPGDKLPTDTILPDGTTDGGYFVKVGSDIYDKVIKPGDKFMFYADNCYISGTTEYLLWTYPEHYGYGPLGEMYTWSIIDRNSAKKIATSKLILD
ncbi:MAG: type IV pilin N-terminal domain-containing protein [Methanoregulaceae archaeon]|jgi:hypothetical protein